MIAIQIEKKVEEEKMPFSASQEMHPASSGWDKQNIALSSFLFEDNFDLLALSIVLMSRYLSSDNMIISCLEKWFVMPWKMMHNNQS